MHIVVGCEMSCHVMWFSFVVMWCNAMSCDVLSCDVMSSDVIWHDAMGWDVMRLWCDVGGCEVLLCDSKWLSDVVNWTMICSNYGEPMAVRQALQSIFVLLSSSLYSKVLPSILYYKVLQSIIYLLQTITKYYSVLQSTIPYSTVVLAVRTTKYCISVLQSI